MSTRKQLHNYLLHGRPDWADAAARAEELLDYLDAVETDRATPCLKQFQCPSVSDIAFAAESTGEALWGESNDLLHPSAFLRIFTSRGTRRSAMQCTRFLARVRGRLLGVYAEHRVIVMKVDPADFVIAETL